jgi:hypothetical protein
VGDLVGGAALLSVHGGVGTELAHEDLLPHRVEPLRPLGTDRAQEGDDPGVVVAEQARVHDVVAGVVLAVEEAGLRIHHALLDEVQAPGDLVLGVLGSEQAVVHVQAEHADRVALHEPVVGLAGGALVDAAVVEPHLLHDLVGEPGELSRVAEIARGELVQAVHQVQVALVHDVLVRDRVLAESHLGVVAPHQPRLHFLDHDEEQMLKLLFLLGGDQHGRRQPVGREGDGVLPEEPPLQVPAPEEVAAGAERAVPVDHLRELPDLVFLEPAFPGRIEVALRIGKPDGQVARAGVDQSAQREQGDGGNHSS